MYSGRPRLVGGATVLGQLVEGDEGYDVPGWTRSQIATMVLEGATETRLVGQYSDERSAAAGVGESGTSACGLLEVWSTMASQLEARCEADD